MNVDMKNFQPFTLFSPFTKGNVNTADTSVPQNETHINKPNVATSILSSKLNAALGSNDNKQSGVIDFETVGKNVLGFITSTIQNAQNNGASKEKLEGMLLDAQSGIKDGFSNATDVLKETGLLTDDIKQGIHETQHFLSEGLNKLSEKMFNENPVMTPLSSSYSEASHYNLSKDASFSFTTKEGDEVNITFNSDYLQQNVSIINQTENGTSSIHSQKVNAQSAFLFEVNGELNEEEQEAINKLMSSLQNVSNLFFEGNLEDAFEQAKSISMDPTHLAAFSMDLQRTETVVTIKEYQQFMPGKDIATQLIPVNDELASAYEHAKPFAIEEHLTELLGWLMPEDKETNDALVYSQAILDKLYQSN